MTEPVEGPSEAGKDTRRWTSSPVPRDRQAGGQPLHMAAGRAGELWKLLGIDEALPPTSAEASPGVRADASADVSADVSTEPTAGNEVWADASWTVERLPSPDEGGVLGLFTGDTAAPAEPSGAGTGRARLAAMLDHLPSEPRPRVGPEDVQVPTPVVAPAAIWFWGDDDIYPGRLPSAARSRRAGDPPTKKRRRRR